ncbi:MAG TPA: response regulator [Chloroflexota bacterium]|nr:response regulator [Chloroflexota bacterium]
MPDLPTYAFSPKRVLVVEDDPVILEIVAEVLGEIDGLIVDTAGDGGTALRMARAAPPDALLLDLMTPVLDGPQLVRALRADRGTRHIPIAVMSAAAALDAITDELHIEAHLHKPFDLRELEQTVCKLLELNWHPFGLPHTTHSTCALGAKCSTAND